MSSASKSATKRSDSGTSSSLPCSPKSCATANPGVPLRWHLDELHVKVGGSTRWLWRAVDEYRDVLDILLQEHRDTEAAKFFFIRLLGEYDVPKGVQTDKLRRYGAAIRALPVFHSVEHGQVESTVRCTNLVEQSHRPTRQQERAQVGF